MMISNVFSQLAAGVATAGIKLQTMVAASVDVNDLLSGDGAAGNGGALEEVNKQVQQYGKGGFTIMQNITVYGIAIALLIAAVLLGLHAGNPNKRDEQKSAIVWIVVAAVLAFSGVSILIFAQKIGSALFG